jgi:hypothetical protein
MINIVSDDELLINDEDNYDFDINEYANYTELFNNAIEVVSDSYNIEDNGYIRNTEFIENIWLEENAGLDSKLLSESITNIYIYYPETEQEYNFYYDSISHIMENFRIPPVMTKRKSYLLSSIFFNTEYEIIDKKWDYIFYIYTNDFIYYSNGLRNEQGKYFNIIPRIVKHTFI